MKLRFWQRRKKKVAEKELDLSVLLGSVSNKVLAWLFPADTIMIEGIEEISGTIRWELAKQPFEAQVQASPLKCGNYLLYFVRDFEPFTFNPYLQLNWDPETIERYKEVALQYFLEKDPLMKEETIEERIKQLERDNKSYWITNGLMGTLGRDSSDKEFFQAQRMGIFNYLLIMGAGVGLWEGVQILFGILGGIFK